METDKEHIRRCLLFEFDKGSTAAAACRNIREGDRSCQDQPRSGRPAVFAEEDLDQAIRNNPKPTVEELADIFQVHRTTVERRLKALGFTTKFDRWVPHQLSANQREVRVATSVSLLSRYKNNPFLPHIVTGNEKWIMYRNVKYRVAEPPPSTSKPELHPTKVLLSVWWDVNGVIHWELLPPHQTINATFYCEQLDRLRAALRSKRPRLVNRQGVIIQHDNARPHAAVITQQKLLGFGWEVLPHPPYSPDLAPTDYHLFRALQHAFARTIFDDVKAVQTA